MEIEEMENALSSMENAIEFMRDAGEDGLASKVIDLMAESLDRFEAMGGDRTIFDAA